MLSGMLKLVGPYLWKLVVSYLKSYATKEVFEAALDEVVDLIVESTSTPWDDELRDRIKEAKEKSIREGKEL